MAKRHIGRDGKINSRGKKAIVSKVVLSEIDREIKNKKKTAKSELELGPRMLLKNLIVDKRYPVEEAKKTITRRFKNLENYDEILEAWIKDIKDDMKRKKQVAKEGIFDGR